MTFQPGPLREALAAACLGAEDALGRKVATSAYIPDRIDPPWIYPSDLSWALDSMGDTWSAVATIRILTSRSEDRAGQENLDVLIPAVTTLLQATGGVTVQSGTGYDLIPIAGVEYYGAELTCIVLPEVLV